MLQDQMFVNSAAADGKAETSTSFFGWELNTGQLESKQLHRPHVFDAVSLILIAVLEDEVREILRMRQ